MEIVDRPLTHKEHTEILESILMDSFHENLVVNEQIKAFIEDVSGVQDGDDEAVDGVAFVAEKTFGFLKDKTKSAVSFGKEKFSILKETVTHEKENDARFAEIEARVKAIEELLLKDPSKD